MNERIEGEIKIMSSEAKQYLIRSFEDDIDRLILENKEMIQRRRPEDYQVIIHSLCRHNLTSLLLKNLGFDTKKIIVSKAKKL